MRIAIHQPDLLPYSGFWYKMAISDGFIVARHDQFKKYGYQRRTKMRDTWCSIPLVGKPGITPITHVTALPGWQRVLIDGIGGRYRSARHWSTRGEELTARIAALDVPGDALDEVNLALMEVIREMLQIRTPLLFTNPPTVNGPPRLIEQVLAVGGDEYVSGSGGAAYLGEDAPAEFAAHGIRLEWSRHQHTTGDSIVTALLDDDDPMATVLRRVPDDDVDGRHEEPGA